GNLDTPEIRPGTTVYLGVNVPGALFAFGDGHARQGQGEVCGVAVETAMNVTVAVGLIKNTVTPWPRIETDDRIISIGAARPISATWTRPRSGPARPSTWASTCLARSSRSATGTPGRVRARSAAWPSRPP